MKALRRAVALALVGNEFYTMLGVSVTYSKSRKGRYKLARRNAAGNCP
ncbi:MAG: hypothetical protein LBU34_04265 [Planctomycetaceae bacterium]|nr:hypothetical protein [Planctomycetaceae bacterium]